MPQSYANSGRHLSLLLVDSQLHVHVMVTIFCIRNEYRYVAASTARSSLQEEGARAALETANVGRPDTLLIRV